VRSLFVVSLPRSLSTTIYHAAAHALRLREPSFTTGGEILNRDRLRIGHRRGALASDARFTLKEEDPELFATVTNALRATAEPDGFAYKDVVQPFVVADWLDKGAFSVLKVRREVAEVAFAMLRREWHYAGAAASLHTGQPWATVEGLLRAEATLEALPGETVCYADCLTSHEPLDDALRRLYPEVGVEPVSYIDRRFARTRRRLAETRRESSFFQELQEIVAATRERLAAESHLGRLPVPLSAAASR
jgi:hypothetical protein